MKNARSVMLFLTAALAAYGGGCGGDGPTGGSPTTGAQFSLTFFKPTMCFPGTSSLRNFDISARVDTTRSGGDGTIEEDWRFVFTKDGAPSWELTKANMETVLGSGVYYLFAADIKYPGAGHISISQYNLPASFPDSHPCDAAQVTIHVRDASGKRHELTAIGKERI